MSFEGRQIQTHSRLREGPRWLILSQNENCIFFSFSDRGLNEERVILGNLWKYWVTASEVFTWTSKCCNYSTSRAVMWILFLRKKVKVIKPYYLVLDWGWVTVYTDFSCWWIDCLEERTERVFQVWSWKTAPLGIVEHARQWLWGQLALFWFETGIWSTSLQRWATDREGESFKSCEGTRDQELGDLGFFVAKT